MKKIKERSKNIFIKVKNNVTNDIKRKLLLRQVNTQSAYQNFLNKKFLFKKNKNSLKLKLFFFIGFLQLNQRKKYKLTRKSYYRLLNIVIRKRLKKNRIRRVNKLKKKRRMRRFFKRSCKRNTKLQRNRRKRKLRRMRKKKRKFFLERKSKYTRMYLRLLKYKKRKKLYKYFFKRNIFYYKLNIKRKNKLIVQTLRDKRINKASFKQYLELNISSLTKRYIKRNSIYVKSAKRIFLNKVFFSLKSARMLKGVYNRYFIFHKRIKLFKNQKFKRKKFKRIIKFLQVNLQKVNNSKKRDIKLKVRKSRRIQKRKRRLLTRIRRRYRKSFYFYLFFKNSMNDRNIRYKFNLNKKWWRHQIIKYKKRYGGLRLKNKDYMTRRLHALNKKVAEKYGRKFLLKSYNKRIKLLFKRYLKYSLRKRERLLTQTLGLYAVDQQLIHNQNIKKFNILKMLLLGLIKSEYFYLNISILKSYTFNGNILLNSNLLYSNFKGDLNNLGLRMVTYMLKLKWFNKKLYRRLNERMLLKSDKYTYIATTNQKQRQLLLPKIKYNFIKLSKYFEEFKKLKYILKRKGKKTRSMYLMFNKLNEIYQYKVRRLGKKYFFMLRKDKLPKIGLFILTYLKRNMYITLLNKKTKRVLGSTTARKNYLAKKQIEQEEELLKDNDSIGLTKDSMNLKMRAGTYIKKKKHRVNVLLNTLEAVQAHNYSVIDFCIKIKYKRRFLMNFLNFTTYDYKGFIRMIQVANQKPHGFMRKKKARRL
uniref:Mp36-like protein n=1 Tax=Heterostelium pallidum TaxID=13642 RepID=B2XX57_HETPA|nr:Mp36-like protein [Heterostelium pallidum]